jgi:hypothetical protein
MEILQASRTAGVTGAEGRLAGSKDTMKSNEAPGPTISRCADDCDE